MIKSLHRFPLVLTCMLLLGVGQVLGQIPTVEPGGPGVLTPAEWEVSLSSETYEVGDEVDVVFAATIDSDWYLYSSDFDPDLGPMVTTFLFEENDTYETVGELRAINPSKGYDEIFEGEYTYFKGTGEFRQTIRVLNESMFVSGSYEYQVCSDIDGKCIPFDDEFQLGQPIANIVEEGGDEGSFQTGAEISNPADKSMLGFMFFAFISGLIALLTPCVFPMIPMTVTFFMKDEESGKGRGFKNAVAFGISIILIFSVLGTLVAFLFGAETLNEMATHWLPNVFVFIIFVVFAFSFLGMYEITLPSSWVNKMDQEADKRSGLGGVFFMAATLALVSFSCTFPIVGSVLVLSTQGQFLKPIMGMLAFSMAFAMPFTLFAAFPEWLKSLPKSGGWLNSVKVVLGFLELALGLKFLSVADQAYHWNLLDREVYLALWIVIFTLIGFYLLGKIRLPHDSKLEVIGVPRLILAVLTFSFVIYLIPGLWGAPLKALAGYLPPMSTHDFNMVGLLEGQSKGQVATGESDLCDEPKFAELLHFPHGIEGYFDYEQAISCARQQNKPLFIDFTGHGCVNCREMEARVWSDPRVLQRLKTDFVVVALYVDDKTTLPESEWYTSEFDGKTKKTIGKQNADFQITRFNNNAQPFYVILDGEERLMMSPRAYDLDPTAFVEFLDQAKSNYYRSSDLARK